MDSALSYLSVCSGIEAATVAWEPLGFRPVAFAEVAPFPKAVLAHRYPDVRDLGDMTRIDAAALPDVDILVGGPPCQAFSLAGHRRGLADERGRLILAYADLAHALSTRARPLRYVLFENVPELLRSRSDPDAAEAEARRPEREVSDFGCFLGYLLGSDAVLEPPDGGWPNAGLASGPWGRVAWRVLRSEFFGLPQRRPRLFLVGCPAAGHGDPAAVLYDREGGEGHDAPPTHEGTGPESDALDVVGGARRDSRDAESGDDGRAKRGDGTPRLPVHGRFGLTRPLHFNGYGTPLSFQATALMRGDSKKVEVGVITERGMRRYTPVERERLQGFADDWTDVPWKAKGRKEPGPAPYGLRVEAVGNSMPVPVVRWLGERIAADAARAG